MSGHKVQENPLKQSGLLSQTAFFAALEGVAKNTVQNVHILQITDSTNTRLGELAKNGAPHGTVVMAEEQTAGKGRLGRSFYSPAHTGLYLSVLYKSDIYNYEKVFNPALYTIAAAVAVTRALKDVCGVDAGIKWVNDIYVNNKKVCGILAEGVVGASAGIPACIIIGIGINIQTADFPNDIKNRAGSVFCDTVLSKTHISRNRLAAKIVSELFTLLKSEQTHVLTEYRKKSFILNSEIKVIEGQKIWLARARDIDENGGLVVELPDGSRKTLNSGEVSIREHLGQPL